jgi:hypothetical protein
MTDAQLRAYIVREAAALGFTIKPTNRIDAHRSAIRHAAGMGRVDMRCPVRPRSAAGASSLVHMSGATSGDWKRRPRRPTATPQRQRKSAPVIESTRLMQRTIWCRSAFMGLNAS